MPAHYWLGLMHWRWDSPTESQEPNQNSRQHFLEFWNRFWRGGHPPILRPFQFVSEKEK